MAVPSDFGDCLYCQLIREAQTRSDSEQIDRKQEKSVAFEAAESRTAPELG